MRRTSLVTAILMSCALGATAIAAQDGGSPAGISGAAAQVAAPMASANTLDDAAAAAVIGALRMQFDNRQVELQLQQVDKTRASKRDLVLDGIGKIRIEGSEAWLPIRFQALYDTATGVVLSPSVTLDRGQKVESMQLPMAGLHKAIASRLGEEFSAQEVGLELEDARVTGGDARYAVVDGSGIVDFASEGQAALMVQAVLDRQSGQWVSVDYSLGEELGSDTAFVALN